MLRYLRSLADKDYALDRGMIPLGSCTMKLNATTEMEPITWPEFANMHPFAPADQAAGYAALIAQLEALAGRDHRVRRGLACSRTPAPRASWPGCWRSGPTTGATATTGRDVCLIPSSAHGTNAASAVMAGMRVVVVACDDDGNIDLGDLARKIEAAPRRAGRDHGHLPVDPRRLRDRDRRAVRRGARRRRPGVRRRRQPQRAARLRQAGPVRRRRVAPEPAQDVLHPARRRRPRRRPGRRCGRTSRRTCRATRWRSRRRRRRAGLGGSARLRRHPADPVGVPADDGPGRPGPRDRRRGAGRQLRRGPAARPLPGALRRQQGPGRARVHPRPAADHARRPASPSTTWPSG